MYDEEKTTPLVEGGSGSRGQTFCLLFRRYGDSVYDDGEKNNNTGCT